METDTILGNSSSIKKSIYHADKFARSPLPVLLLGESGVGKELFAHRIHKHSKVASRPFSALNCSALPAGLFESELFGHERGAFSGATTSHPGLLKATRGGTIFLDEIGELPLNLQAKLLRVLQSGEFRSVGSTRTEKCQVRFIAATNVNLYQAVNRGDFRLDLLQRLSVLTLQIDPLHERVEDIKIIAQNILSQEKCRYDKRILDRLSRFPWIGNVRQLKNFLLRASVLGDNHLSEKLIDELLRAESRWLMHEEDPLRGTLAEVEKRVIVERLNRCQGNRTQTAKELGIAKSTLHEKLKRWQMVGRHTMDRLVSLPGNSG